MKNIRKVDWAARTEGYIKEINNPYHMHRARVMKTMIPVWSLQQGVRIFDFGCGDGFLIPFFFKLVHL